MSDSVWREKLWLWCIQFGPRSGGPSPAPKWGCRTGRSVPTFPIWQPTSDFTEQARCATGGKVRNAIRAPDQSPSAQDSVRCHSLQAESCVFPPPNRVGHFLMASKSMPRLTFPDLRHSIATQTWKLSNILIQLVYFSNS
jgi:hypothetical protein